MIPNYDQEIEKLYHPENFESESERELYEFAVEMGLEGKELLEFISQQ